MSQEAKKLFDVLFDKEDAICVAMSSRGTKVSPPCDRYNHLYEFYSLNPIYEDVDLRPEKTYHSADTPRRADHNVTKMRNFVFEVDNMTLEEQKSKIDDVVIEKGFPITAIVFSGSKSYHMIVSLVTPVEGPISYRETWIRLWNWLKEQGLKCDASTKNPSRLTRYPGNVRYSTGKKQDLIYCGSRIEDSVIEKFLEKCELPASYRGDFEKENTFDSAIGQYLALYGVNPNSYSSSRHISIWSVGENLKMSGASYEVVEFMLKELNESWGENNLTEEQIKERLASIYRR